MDKVLLSLHVLAAIIFIGPVTVAVSLFPRHARQALAGRAPESVPGRAGAPTTDAQSTAQSTAQPTAQPTLEDTPGRDVGVTLLLHRITRAYSVLGLSVPVLGIALAASMGVLGDAWLVISIVLTGAAALLLAAVIVPAQNEAVELLRDPTGPRAADAGSWAERAPRLAMASGMFSLLWAVVVVLMVVRPGSTTGV